MLRFHRLLPYARAVAVQTSSYPERRCLRLPSYDYAEVGAYFITAVTEGRTALFGQIHDGDMRLSRFGAIVEQSWRDLVNHYPHVALDEFIVMPNHIHGVVWLRDPGRAGVKRAPTRHPLSEIIRAFKTFSARRINELRGTPGRSLWQRNYYERVVRHERELNAIREYIRANPLNWHLDRENVIPVGAGFKPARPAAR
jgi:putative transposase